MNRIHFATVLALELTMATAAQAKVEGLLYRNIVMSCDARAVLTVKSEWRAADLQKKDFSGGNSIELNFVMNPREYQTRFYYFPDLSSRDIEPFLTGQADLNLEMQKNDGQTISVLGRFSPVAPETEKDPSIGESEPDSIGITTVKKFIIGSTYDIAFDGTAVSGETHVEYFLGQECTVSVEWQAEVFTSKTGLKSAPAKRTTYYLKYGTILRPQDLLKKDPGVAKALGLKAK